MVTALGIKTSPETLLTNYLADLFILCVRTMLLIIIQGAVFNAKISTIKTYNIEETIKRMNEYESGTNQNHKTTA
jgi:hypothetical protein